MRRGRRQSKKTTAKSTEYEEDTDEEEDLQYEKPTPSLAGSLGS